MSEYQLSEFRCALCGNCCRGDGYVRISPTELARIAEHLQLPKADFVEQFTRAPEIVEHSEVGDLWLIDKPGPEQECIFLENNRCAINAVKPSQCIGFPLKWRTPDIMEYCEGMRRAQ
jgi:uncharacterized protein